MTTKLSIYQLQNSVIERFNNGLIIANGDETVLSFDDIATSTNTTPTAEQIMDTKFLTIVEDETILGLAMILSVDEDNETVTIARTLFAEGGSSEASSLQIYCGLKLTSDIVELADLMTACGDEVTWTMLENTCLIYLIEDDVIVGMGQIVSINKVTNSIELSRTYFATSVDITDLKNKIDDKQDKLVAGANIEIDSVTNVISSDLSDYYDKTETTTAINNALAGLVVDGMQYIGLVDGKDNLPLTGNKKGDLHVDPSTNVGYVWNLDTDTGTIEDWKEIGNIFNIDLSALEADLAATQQAVINNAAAINNITTVDIVNINDEIDGIDQEIDDLQDAMTDAEDNIDLLTKELEKLKESNISPYRDVIYPDSTTFLAKVHKDYFFNIADELVITLDAVTDTEKEARVKVGFISGASGTSLILFPATTVLPSDFSIQPNSVYLLEFYYKSGEWHLVDDVNHKQNKLTAGNGVEITNDNIINVDTSGIVLDGYVTDDELEEAVNDLTDFNRINPNNMVRLFDGKAVQGDVNDLQDSIEQFEGIVVEEFRQVGLGVEFEESIDNNNPWTITSATLQTGYEDSQYKAFNKTTVDFFDCAFFPNSTTASTTDTWLEVDFMEERELGSISYTNPSYTNNFCVVTSLDVKYYNSTLNQWVDLGVITGMDENETYYLSFNTIKTSKVRIAPTGSKYVTSAGGLTYNVNVRVYDIRFYGQPLFNVYRSQIITSKIGTHVINELGCAIEFKDDGTFEVISLDDSNSMITGIYGLTKESTSGAASVGEAHDLTPQVDGVKTVFDIDSSILEEYNKSLYYSGLLMNEVYDYTIDYTNSTLTTTFVPNSDEERRLILLVDDNTSSGGSGGGAIATKEIINPFTFDGVETTFDVSSLNVNSKSKVYINGLRLTNTIDFNLVGTDIVFTTAWDNTDSCLLEVEEV